MGPENKGGELRLSTTGTEQDDEESQNNISFEEIVAAGPVSDLNFKQEIQHKERV